MSDDSGEMSVLVSVKIGNSVTLNSGLTEIMEDDQIQWRFFDDPRLWWSGYEYILIAEINKQTDSMTVYDDVLDGRFRDRLKLNKQTGSLTIINTTTQHAGHYKLQTKYTKIDYNFTVYGVFGDKDEVKSVSVMEGDSVTLNSDLTEIQKDDLIMWKLGHDNLLIATLNRVSSVFGDSDEVKSVSVSVMEGDSVTLNTDLTEIQTDYLIMWTFVPNNLLIVKLFRMSSTSYTYDVHTGRFGDRLKLDHQTGSLTITNTKTTDSGLYEVTTGRNRQIKYRFHVTVS
ncbi:hypothetical protein cypCar_00045182, partial [Cyprinus carpio]